MIVCLVLKRSLEDKCNDKNPFHWCNCLSKGNCHVQMVLLYYLFFRIPRIHQHRCKFCLEIRINPLFSWIMNVNLTLGYSFLIQNCYHLGLAYTLICNDIGKRPISLYIFVDKFPWSIHRRLYMMAAALQLKNIETLIHFNAQIFAETIFRILNIKEVKFYRYCFDHL